MKFFLSAISFLFAITHSAICPASLFGIFGDSIPAEKEGDYALVVSRIGVNGDNMDTLPNSGGYEATAYISWVNGKAIFPAWPQKNFLPGTYDFQVGIGCGNTATCHPSSIYHLFVRAGYRYVLTPNAVYVSDRKSPRSGTETPYGQFEQEMVDYQRLGDSDSITSSAELSRLINEFQNKDPKNLIPHAKSRMQTLLAQDNLQRYRSEFKQSTTSDSLKHFIAMYQNNDPDGLVAQAERKLPDVVAKEAADAHIQYRQAFESASSKSDLEAFIGKFQGNDPDHLVPKAQLKLKSIIAKQDAEERQAREELAKWKNGLQVGDDTNCGEVLELRRGLVKVNFPVENYGNEHWIKKSLILKPGAGCQFVNGNYVPPYNG